MLDNLSKNLIVHAAKRASIEIPWLWRKETARSNHRLSVQATPPPISDQDISGTRIADPLSRPGYLSHQGSIIANFTWSCAPNYQGWALFKGRTLARDALWVPDKVHVAGVHLSSYTASSGESQSSDH